MHLRIALPVVLAGCGSALVSPAAPDASADAPAAVDAPASPADVALPPDDAADGPCARSVSIGDAPVRAAALARVPGGVLIAWAPRGAGGVRARVFDEALAPRSEALVLPSGAGDVDAVSLSFVGGAGALAAGPTLHALRVGDDGALARAYPIDLPGRTLRWVRADSADAFRALTADGGFVVTRGERFSVNEPDAPLAPPHGPGVSVTLPASGGGYNALDVDAPGGVGALVRRFVFGHGASLQVGRVEGGAWSASPLATDARGAHRVTFALGREIDVSLETRDVSLAPPGTSVLLQRGAAWGTTTAAVALDGDARFVVWAAKTAGAFNHALRARWGDDAEVREVDRGVSGQHAVVLGAALDGAAGRAWVLFAARAADDALTLRARCVDRPGR